MRQVSLSRRGGLIALVVALALEIAACGGTTSGPAIGLNASNFTAHAMAVKVNTPVTFDDTVSGGGTHFICVGTGNGGSNTCESAGNGPKEFYSNGNATYAGMMMNAGRKYHVTFPNTGTYHLICTVHPGMYMDIIVSK